MRVRLVVLLAVAIALFSSVGRAALMQDPIVPREGVLIHNGFVTGEAFLEMAAEQQRGYTMGLVDGFFLAPFVGAPKRNMATIEQCVTGMTDGQIVAILIAHLREFPEVWDESVNAEMYRALKLRCTKPAI